MFPQLPSNLDMLASGGVIGFDAESYVYGTPARYWGGPQQNLPMETPLPMYPYNGNTGYNVAPGGMQAQRIQQQGMYSQGMYPQGMYPQGMPQQGIPQGMQQGPMLAPQPTKDTFNPNISKPQTPAWKKVLAGVTGAVLIAGTVFKLKGGKFKQLPTQIKQYNYKKTFTNIKDKVVNFATDLYNKITKKAPTQPPPTPPTP